MSPEGRLVAYVSNKRNGVDFDLWVTELASGEHRLLYSGGGWCQPSSGFSPDGRWVSVRLPGPRPLDEELLLVEVATTEVRSVLAHPDEAAELGPPAWVDSTSFYVSSNVGVDHAGIVRCDIVSGATVPLAGTAKGWDLDAVTSPDGSALLVIENRNGASVMTLLEPDSAELPIEIPLRGTGSRDVVPDRATDVLPRRLASLLHALDAPACRRRLGV